jgi:hypothetical protein
MIGIAGSNHGTSVFNLQCIPGCPPGIWQQRQGAEFIRALNSRQETFRRISYTNIYTHLDEIVVPNSNDQGSSSLHGPGRITNVAVQDVCPLDPVEHLTMASDGPAWKLMLDAYEHKGPADPERLGKTACDDLFMPGVRPLTFPTDTASSAVGLLEASLTYPQVQKEPLLACYVTGTCRRPTRR